MTALTIIGLHLWRGERHLLKGIELTVQQGEVLALLGPSGCGKSTLLSALNRMVEREPMARVSGRIVFEGRDILGAGVDLPALRRQIGLVAQQPAPFPMSIRDNVSYGLRLHERLSRAECDARVRQALLDAALLDEVGHRLDDSALSLSGGQQQRLCIARTLAVGPSVLLLDEPTSALDPLSTARIEALLGRLKRRYTVLLVTHSPAQARRVADRAALLWEGQLLDVGPVARVLDAPRDRRAVAYLAGG